jgi:hypothetical protein
MRSLVLTCSIITTACVSHGGPASVTVDGAPTIKSAYVTYPNAVRIWPTINGGAPGAAGVHGIIVLASSNADDGCSASYNSEVATFDFALPYAANTDPAELDQLPTGYYPVAALDEVGLSVPALATPSVGISVGTNEMTSGGVTLMSITHGRITGAVDASGPSGRPARSTSLAGTFEALLCDHPE